MDIVNEIVEKLKENTYSFPVTFNDGVTYEELVFPSVSIELIESYDTDISNNGHTEYIKLRFTYYSKQEELNDTVVSGRRVIEILRDEVQNYLDSNNYHMVRRSTAPLMWDTNDTSKTQRVFTYDGKLDPSTGYIYYTN